MASCSAPMMPTVSAVLGRCTETTSLVRSSSSSADEADAHLRGAAGGDERVVGDDVHAERRQPLGDQRADAAEADDAGGLLVELDAGVLAALPLPLLEGCVGRRDVAGGGEQQADGQLGGAHDVGLRRVDDHHAGLRRGLDVDVVQADAGAGDDLEAAGGGEAPRRRPLVALRTRIASTSATAGSSAARSAPSTLRTSKSGPSASTVAGESSSAMRTTGLVTPPILGERLVNAIHKCPATGHRSGRPPGVRRVVVVARAGRRPAQEPPSGRSRIQTQEEEARGPACRARSTR